MFKPFALERYFAAHEFSSRYLLCTSDCESMSVEELLALEPGSARALESTWLGYTESRGAPSLREDIAALYQGLGREDVLVCSGAEEAILDFFLATVKKGRHVVVVEPCYQSLREIPRALGARVHAWPVLYENSRWILDPDSLAKILESLSGLGRPEGEAPIVVLNVPHNPTGFLPDRRSFQRIVQICAEKDAILLCDEVYRYLEYDPDDRLPAACELYENAVSLSVLSKAWGLAGLRIGWLASKRADILDSVATVKDYNSICASSPSETLAGIALRHRSEITTRCLELCRTTRSLMDAFFERRKDFFEWTRPDAGSVAFPRLSGEKSSRLWGSPKGDPSGGPDASIVAQRLLDDTGVLLLPGSTYGAERCTFRVGLGRLQSRKALEIFEDWLETSSHA